MNKTDYEPGDFPVPVGAEVEYFGSRRHGRYVVDERVDPHDNRHVEPGQDLSAAYPDGAAYHLWPVGVPKKFDNRYLSVLFARRTSFRVVVEED